MIIGFSGRIGAGKTTIADMIVRRFGFRKRSFADPLKRACREIFGFTDLQFTQPLKETIDPVWGKSPRQILQFVGTDLFRNGFDNNVWVRATMNHINKHQLSDFVIDDVRFPNEAQAIIDCGGVMVQIVRNFDGDKTINVRSLGHSSENSMHDWTAWFDVIRNEGTKAELEGMAVDLVEAVRAGRVVV